jgi:glycosyltransferase involved in cell wall biosynthesis
MLSGVALMAHSLAEAAANHEINTTVLTTQKNPKFNESIKNLNVIQLPGRKNPFRSNSQINIMAPNSIKKILQELKPDVIHFHDPLLTSVQIALLERKTAKIFTNHGSSKFVLSYLPKIFQVKQADSLVWHYFAWFGNQCQLVTTPTMTVLKVLEGFGLKTKGLAISNGVDLKEFSPSHKTKSKIKMELNWPDKFIFYYHGRIDPDKNLELLVKIIPQVIESYPHVHFVISGGKSHTQSKLESLAKYLKIGNDLTWTDPHLEDRIDEYRAADCFLITSKIETQSLVTLQALAVGLPVVAADALALPELVVPNVNGLLFDPESLSSLYQALSKILTASKNALNNMSKASLNIAKQHDRKQTVKEYLKLYRKISNVT